MKIKFVTLTGADDQTDANHMAELSDRFPFVEWAILFSQTKSAVPRYPSRKWVENALPLLRNSNLSAHLCGKWVENATHGQCNFLKDDISEFFQRIQFNLSFEKLSEVLAEKNKFWSCDFGKKQIIVAGPYQKYKLNVPYNLFLEHNAVPLFDNSGGKGIVNNNWPQIVRSDQSLPLFCGYAGGLSPKNIEDQLTKLYSIVGECRIWIDMETKIRTKEKLDLNKCRDVLAIVEQFK